MKPVINMIIRRSLRLLNTLPPEDQSTEAGSEKNLELLVALLSLFRCGDRMLDEGLKRRWKELYLRVPSLPSSGSGLISIEPPRLDDGRPVLGCTCLGRFRGL